MRVECTKSVELTAYLLLPNSDLSNNKLVGTLPASWTSLKQLMDL